MNDIVPSLLVSNSVQDMDRHTSFEILLSHSGADLGHARVALRNRNCS